jgi:hypothetical protein
MGESHHTDHRQLPQQRLGTLPVQSEYVEGNEEQEDA